MTYVPPQAQIVLKFVQVRYNHCHYGSGGTGVTDDIRTTQEIFGDLFGGLASLGARGVDGFVIAKALARLLIQQGVISRDTFIATMREVAQEELGESDEITNFLSATFSEILSDLQVRAQRNSEDGKK
jgi:hypothetical protein